MGSVRPASRLVGVPHSTYSRGHLQLVRFGPELLRPRERRQPRMPNAIPPMVEQRILALALAYPGWGPDRLSLELGREKWGGLKVSANGVWRVLKRHGLNTRAKRLSLVCGYAAPPEPERPEPPPERHIEAKYPGHRVQSTTSTSVAWPAPRAWSGSTPLATWPPLTPGPSSTSAPRTPLPTGPRPWPDVSPRSSPSAAGSWRRLPPITPPSTEPRSSIT